MVLAQTLDRRAHHCVAQPLPPPGQAIVGVPQPKGVGVLAPRLNPPSCSRKTLQSGLNVPGRTFGRLRFRNRLSSQCSSPNSAFASFKSSVSKPSVQPTGRIGSRRSRASYSTRPDRARGAPGSSPPAAPCDFASCLRAAVVASLRSKYASAFSASGAHDMSAISPAVRWISASHKVCLVVSPRSSLRRCSAKPPRVAQAPHGRAPIAAKRVAQCWFLPLSDSQ